MPKPKRAEKSYQEAKPLYIPPKIGWPCVVRRGGGDILGICIGIDSKVRFGEEPPVVEEVAVWQLAQRLAGADFFEPLEGNHAGEIVVEAHEVSSVLARATPDA